MAPLVQRWFATLPVPSAVKPVLPLRRRATPAACSRCWPIPSYWSHSGARARRPGRGPPATASCSCWPAACALWLRRGSRECFRTQASDSVTSVERSVARWTALAFVPSSLMLGVTTHISTDLASFPLLWVLPLAAYLLTFVLVFATRDRGSRARIVARALPVLVLCRARFGRACRSRRRG